MLYLTVCRKRSATGRVLAANMAVEYSWEPPPSSALDEAGFTTTATIVVSYPIVTIPLLSSPKYASLALLQPNFNTCIDNNFESVKPTAVSVP